MPPLCGRSAKVWIKQRLSLQKDTYQGKQSIRNTTESTTVRVVRSGQAASFSLALALTIAAPFSAIMIVGALVFVELTAGITEASTLIRELRGCAEWPN